jgi:hypothetical protein
MIRHIVARGAAALSFCFGITFLAHDAEARHVKTIASRKPICITVADSYYYNLFGVKVPLWVFTNHCTYAEYFYAEFPSTRFWVPSAKFAAHQSVTKASNGMSAKYFNILECPLGSMAIGFNPYVCYKQDR